MNKVNELKENKTEDASELLQSPLYDIDSLRGECTSKKRLDEKLGERNYESTEERYVQTACKMHSQDSERNIRREKIEQ